MLLPERVTRFCALLNHILEPEILWVEARSSFQIPGIQIVGLPSREISESKERVRAAILSSGLEIPRRKIVINLSPADIRKDGAGTDLAITLALLQLQELRPPFETVMAWAELGLGGELRSAGCTTRALYAALIQEIHLLILPETERAAAQKAHAELRDFSKKIPKLIFGDTLKEVIEKLQHGTVEEWHSKPSRLAKESATTDLLPLSPALERVVGVAAAGFHHLLVLGPRGSGKTHAIRWLREVFLPLETISSSFHQMTSELLRTRSGRIREIGTNTHPAALCGSVYRDGVKPGEYSLAHGGLLIANEFPEWQAHARHSLHEPLESGKVCLTRALGSWELPAQFMFAGSGNLCRCGGWPTDFPGLPDSNPLRCVCQPHSVHHYRRKITGPIRDRIDVVIQMTPSLVAIPDSAQASATAPLKKKVSATRLWLIENLGAPPSLLPPEKVESLRIPHSARALLRQSTLRGRHKLIRLAYTLAHWDGLETPEESHIREAFAYRS